MDFHAATPEAEIKCVDLELNVLQSIEEGRNMGSNFAICTRGVGLSHSSHSSTQLPAIRLAVWPGDGAIGPCVNFFWPALSC